jgi:hypothetical protein
LYDAKKKNQGLWIDSSIGSQVSYIHAMKIIKQNYLGVLKISLDRFRVVYEFIT